MVPLALSVSTAKQESVILCNRCAIQMLLVLTCLPSVSLQGRD